MISKTIYNFFLHIFVIRHKWRLKYRRHSVWLGPPCLPHKRCCNVLELSSGGVCPYINEVRRVLWAVAGAVGAVTPCSLGVGPQHCSYSFFVIFPIVQSYHPFSLTPIILLFLFWLFTVINSSLLCLYIDEVSWKVYTHLVQEVHAPVSPRGNLYFGCIQFSSFVVYCNVFVIICNGILFAKYPLQIFHILQKRD